MLDSTMGPRHEFTPLHHAAQGVGGAQNKGILVTRHNATGKVYIEKRIPLALIAQGDSRREVRAMTQCSSSARPHANIVRLLAYDLSPPGHIRHGSLWMQHCELGSLDALMLRYARRGRHVGDEGFVWKVFWDLALAVAYLCTGAEERGMAERARAGKDVRGVAGWNWIMHRDVKPSNVFLTWKQGADGTGYPTVVLGDFGCAVSAEDLRRGSRVRLRGDVKFEAPEASGGRFSEKGDVWGVGLVVHCLVMMAQEPKGTPTEREGAPFGNATSTRPLREAAKVCLCRDMARRPSAAELPRRVWWGYRQWRREGGRGTALPQWAFR